MKTRFIGDVHGKFKQYEKIIKECSTPSIQVGDMGIGFSKWGPDNDLMIKQNASFIRGNHDNPSKVLDYTTYIYDGDRYRLDNIKAMFVGGASSIDRYLREEGVSWWPDEQLSYTELLEVQESYIKYKPDVMVTHECPDFIADIILKAHNRTKLLSDDGSKTRLAFQFMWQEYQPKLWVFGHWHTSFDKVIKGTRFICLNELEYKDIDMENLHDD